jgi:hypothetical protein
MTDMNQYENALLFANLPGTGRWLRASLSGIPGDREPGIFRVDAGNASEYVLWECRWENDDRERIVPLRQIEGVTGTST